MRTSPQTVLHIAALALLCTLILGTLVGLYGWIAGWHSATEFSNGMFVTGSAVVIFGMLSVWGGFTSRGNFEMTYAQSVSDMSLSERAKLWATDALRGYNVLIVAAIIGALMIGLSVLIYTQFG